MHNDLNYHSQIKSTYSFFTSFLTTRFYLVFILYICMLSLNLSIIYFTAFMHSLSKPFFKLKILQSCSNYIFDSNWLLFLLPEVYLAPNSLNWLSSKGFLLSHAETQLNLIYIPLAAKSISIIAINYEVIFFRYTPSGPYLTTSDISSNKSATLGTFGQSFKLLYIYLMNSRHFFPVKYSSIAFL